MLMYPYKPRYIIGQSEPVFSITDRKSGESFVSKITVVLSESRVLVQNASFFSHRRTISLASFGLSYGTCTNLISAHVSICR
jgi:hypothetical protein